MTVPSRGARSRRGGRRPGWPLLTALLVLAIGASSALVFTNRAELLKLAVILALWAAVVAAFVSVIYRRQSDVDQARVRDLKLVYDLQLDREISARREYELTVESHLRRELAAELRAQAADEVAALRAELAALRTNLEILFDTDFEHRPALETERASVRAYSDWEHQTGGGSTPAENSTTRTAENPIIDVPEVGVPPAGERHPGFAAEAPRTADGHEVAAASRGSHWRAADDDGGPPAQERPRPEPVPYGATWADSPLPGRQAEPYRSESVAPATDWQPVGDQGQWLPPGAPGSNWVSEPDGRVAQPEWSARTGYPPQAAQTPEPPRSGRHTTSPEPAAPDETESGRRQDGRRARARHTGGSQERQHSHSGPLPPDSAARHRSADQQLDTADPPSGSQSVADLLARLQVGQPVGGGRRRRAD